MSLRSSIEYMYSPSVTVRYANCNNASRQTLFQNSSLGARPLRPQGILLSANHTRISTPQSLTSSAWGSSRTHSDSALSSASSSSAGQPPHLRHDRARTHLHGHGRAAPASGSGRSGVLCCCLARYPSRTSCPKKTRRWTRRLRGARGICSILGIVSQGLHSRSSAYDSEHTFTTLLPHALVVYDILCPLDVSSLLWLSAQAQNARRRI